jgi:hypothetical protein
MDSTEPVQAQIFSGHESFPLRLTWLTKAVRNCEPKHQRDLFSRPDAMVPLGVGKNMVRSMRSWAIQTKVLEPDGDGGRVKRLRPTAIGTLLFGRHGHDPYMEDPATVWLLHWSLASNPKLATWYWTFNELRETEFHRSTLVTHLLRLSQQTTDRPVAQETVERDVDCFLRTYVPSDPDKRLSREELLDCPLTELGLIRRSGGKEGFIFLRGARESLPNALFAYCLLTFWHSRKASSAESLRFEDVAYAPGSPGQVFKLSENALVDRLHQMSQLTAAAIRYDDTAGLRQVFRERSIEPETLLYKHYGIKIREARHAATR